ncbi:hypothetical protein LTR09_003445 [Extremus antarcticus]|uniref:Ankyrin repeat protein n=1 Tax=Extremus antarcticus TaxID=702011 RepID=A0AAJ0DRI7_9PEZI|nr:hypothetical protein LTR09_003445 [Extremus antarcticus]
MNVSHSPDPTPHTDREQPSPVLSIEENHHELPDAPTTEQESTARAATNGDADEHNDSEAETEIESPVKKREAEKQQQQQNNIPLVKTEKPQKSRIGSLPVPQDDDDDAESVASLMDSTEVSIGKAVSNGGDAKHDEDEHMKDQDDLDDDDSDELSTPRSDDNGSLLPSRAASERLQQSQNRSAGSPNPRKRKHRASSISLPSSKRQSMDPPKRTLPRNRNGMSVDVVGLHDRSHSPESRSYRRAFSPQSAVDGLIGSSSSRKRRSVPSLPGREVKSAKTWDESSTSSETTSRGQLEELKRPQRGSSNRWSSATPAGRPGGREHKRHVNKYGYTRLAEACEDGSLDVVKEWREKDPDQLEIAEFAGNKPLQIAALNGNIEVVTYLIEQGCQIECANGVKDTPLIDAAENGHLEVVNLLLEAGVDPLRQNQKGQQALDVITDETDDATSIRAALHSAIDHWNSSEAKQRREVEEEQRHRAGPSKELHFMARTYENLLKLVQNNDRNGVREFLAARVPVDNAIIAAAARTGDLYLVNMLLAEMTEKKASQKPEKPMLSVLGSSHFEMVQALTQLDHFNPSWTNRAGKTWPEIAEERAGPMWRQEKELLTRLFEAPPAGGSAGKERRSSSPVAKRDGLKRRLTQPKREEEVTSNSSSDEEREAEGRGKRKNGRRLMSRRDMRAVGSKGGLSDLEDSELDAEGEMEVDESEPVTMTTRTIPAEDEVMKPPETPNTRRRLRSESISSPAQPVLTAAGSPKTRLRRTSSSLRGAQELPTLTEEDKDLDHDMTTLPSTNHQQEEIRIKKERQEEAKFRLAEAQRLENQRKEEEAAAEEARRAEEAARKAEDDRIAEEQRKAEELRQRQEAEQARKAVEERSRLEAEAESQRRAYEAQVLAALPRPLARVLDSAGSDQKLTNGGEREHASQHFLPLRILGDSSPTMQPEEADPWVLNLQAAPLLGKRGVPLFFQPEKPGYTGSVAELWQSKPLQESDWRCVDQGLARLAFEESDNNDSTDSTYDTHDDQDLSMAEELRRAAARYRTFADAKSALRKADSPVALRRVRLSDVRKHLRPGHLEAEIELDTVIPVQAPDSNGTVRAGEVDFAESLRRFWEQDALRLRNLRAVDDAPDGHGPDTATSVVQWSEVMVVHEK